VIEPALSTGTWVISDRFSDSTFVYQGLARGVGIDAVRNLQRAALGNFAPDLTIILDVEPQSGLERTLARGAAENRFEQFDGKFHTRLREGFLSIAAQEPQRCAVVDASAPPEAVAAHVWRTVVERLAP
jgi:dTMP kinase